MKTDDQNRRSADAGAGFRLADDERFIPLDAKRSSHFGRASAKGTRFTQQGSKQIYGRQAANNRSGASQASGTRYAQAGSNQADTDRFSRINSTSAKDSPYAQATSKKTDTDRYFRSTATGYNEESGTHFSAQDLDGARFVMPPQPVHEPERKPKSRGRSLLREFIELIIILALALIIVTLLRTFVIDQYQIPTSSMEPTILGNEQVKDHIFAEKVSYHFNMPQPGDIITFNDPTQEGRILIKRCVAVGGQTIDFNDQGRVLIDGQIISEPYTHGKPTVMLDEMPGLDISYPYTIPQDSVWVMGDNRTNSLDSRYFGPIKQDELVGKALFRSWPLNRFGAIE